MAEWAGGRGDGNRRGRDEYGPRKPKPQRPIRKIKLSAEENQLAADLTRLAYIRTMQVGDEYVYNIGALNDQPGSIAMQGAVTLQDGDTVKGAFKTPSFKLPEIYDVLNRQGIAFRADIVSRVDDTVVGQVNRHFAMITMDVGAVDTLLNSERVQALFTKIKAHRDEVIVPGAADSLSSFELGVGDYERETLIGMRISAESLLRGERPVNIPDALPGDATREISRRADVRNIQARRNEGPSSMGR